jgi:carboxypeptidase PM20D1
LIIAIIISFFAIVLFLLASALVRTFYIRSTYLNKFSSVYPVSPSKNIDSSAKNLSKAITFRTVQTGDSSFATFHQFLETTYPRIYSTLTILYKDTQNLVYLYKGQDESLLPALITAHQDVVPANKEEWIHPPFSGDIEDGFVYGRGSFDDKGSLIAILEAVEQLLEDGFIPKRDWYIAFGCDEETRGDKGAALLAKKMRQEGLTFSVVLDEGGAVVEGFFKAISQPIAAVGVCEKGNAHVNISSFVEGGHSSTPKNPTSVGVLAKHISYIEHHPLKPVLIAPIKKMLFNLGLHAPFTFAYMLLNTWLFSPIIFSIFKKNTTMNALIRSTCAVTMVRGSEAANIISNKAHAVLNIRLLPNQSAEEVINQYKKKTKKESISYEIAHENARSKVSSTDTKSFKHLETTISSIFPNTIITPYVLTGGSDALHYESVCDAVYRFTPALMNNSELSRMHNTNERFSIENLSSAISFYKTFITQDIF